MPTAYAIAHGARVDVSATLDGNHTRDWWLRTRGNDWFYYAAIVYGFGSVNPIGISTIDSRA